MYCKLLIVSLLGALVAKGAQIPPYLPPPGDFRRAEVIRPAEPGKRSLNGEWKFSGLTNSAQPFPADADLELVRPDYDDSQWGTIPVPLDWYQKFPEARKEKESYVKGTYRREFELSAQELNRKRVILKFDCVGYDARVFLNGREVGGHRGDFTPFEVDATEAAKPGKNLLAVRVFTDFGNVFGSRKTVDHVYGTQWWIGNIRGGIWQDVTLSLEPELRIRQMLVTPRLAEQAIEVDYLIENHTGKPFTGSLIGRVESAMKQDAGKVAGKFEIPVDLDVGLNKGIFTLPLKEPELWSVKRPYLYFLKAVVHGDGVHSEKQCRFGFREFRTANGKFYLNNEEIYLFGENIAPVMFAGEGKTAEQLDRELADYILGCRNQGYVILRTSHQPLTKQGLKLADECGMMIFDEWGWSFVTDIDPETFISNNLRELREFVENAYNHPSVVMWSLGNEIVHGDTYGPVAKALDAQYDLVRKLDRQNRPASAFSGFAGWTPYGQNPLKTDVFDQHTYVALSAPWTERNEEADKIYAGLLRMYGEKRRLSRPLVAWENVGFSWGFEYPNNKNADFRKDDVDEYLRYADGETDWGNPRGIGYSGCMSLAEAVDPAVSCHVPMARFGRRIFELYRLDRRYSGFAPWFSQPALKATTLWTQPVFPSIHNAAYLFPRNLYCGESSRWIAEAVGGRKGMKFTVTLFDGSRSYPVTEFDVKDDVGQSTELPMPPVRPGNYQLRLTLTENGRECGRNYYDLFLRERPASVKTVRPVYLYDTGVAANTAVLAEQLRRLDIPFKTIRAFAGLEGVVVVPPEKEKQTLQLGTDPDVAAFLEQGGILLVLEQKNLQSKFPGNLSLMEDSLAFADPVISTHPALAGLDAHSFDSWNNPDKGYVVTRSFTPVTSNLVVAKGVRLSRKNVGMALVEAKVGKGRLILSQLEAFASMPQDSAAAAYWRNLIAYAAGSDELWAGARELAAVAEAGYSIVPERAVSVNLAPYANRSFTDETAGDRKGGWTDQGANDFRTMPLGRVEAAGVPFEIIDPAKNAGKSCLILAGTDRNYFPEAIRGIRVGGKFLRLFFLHTAAWGDQPEAGRYRIFYADGKSIDYILNGKRNIGNWWGPSPLPEAKVGVAGNNLGTYVAEWVNPRPEMEIASIDFLSPLYRDKANIDWLPTKTAVPILVAVTGEAAHAAPAAISGDRFRACWPARETGSGIPGNVQEDCENGKRIWRASFQESPLGEVPAVCFSFDAAGLGSYDYLTLRISSNRNEKLHVVLPERDWKGSYSGTLALIGDNRYYTYRLRFGKELRGPASLTPAQLRGELFFFYRADYGDNRARPALDFTIQQAVLE